jgi:hypothetical protein
VPGCKLPGFHMLFEIDFVRMTLKSNSDADGGV